MTIDEMIMLLEAARDGKTIQLKQPNGIWEDTSYPQLAFPLYDYRIKPEPMEIWVNVWDNKFIGGAYETKESAENSIKAHRDTIPIVTKLFREVI